MAQHRCRASGCPRRAHRRPQGYAGFVLEHDQRVLAPCPSSTLAIASSPTGGWLHRCARPLVAPVAASSTSDPGAGGTTRAPGDTSRQYSLDHLCHALQGPQFIRILVGFRTVEQVAFDVSKLVSAQLRQPPGPTCARQTIPPRPTPGGTPIRHDLVRDSPGVRRRLESHPARTNRRPASPFLQRGKVASWANLAIHRPARCLPGLDHP
jgi:hypothetical protein